MNILKWYYLNISEICHSFAYLPGERENITRRYGIVQCIIATLRFLTDVDRRSGKERRRCGYSILRLQVSTAPQIVTEISCKFIPYTVSIREEKLVVNNPSISEKLIVRTVMELQARASHPRKNLITESNWFCKGCLPPTVTEFHVMEFRITINSQSYFRVCKSVALRNVI